MIGNADDLIAYAAARGVTVDPLLAPVWLTRATDYLNSKCWIGVPETPDQDDAWPRTWLQCPELDVTVTGTPKVIITAAYRLAMAVGEGVDLMPTTAGKQIVEAAISGAVSVKYDAGSIGSQPDFPWWDSLVGDFLKCSGDSINFDVFRG